LETFFIGIRILDELVSVAVAAVAVAVATVVSFSVAAVAWSKVKSVTASSMIQ
jgi:hypothetical protein